MTYELFFQKSSITACVCVVDHYHTRVEIQQMAQTHKKINKIHSVEIQSLTTDAFIHMKRTHHPLLTTPLSTFNLLGIIFTWMIPSSDRTRGCLIHVTQNIGIISNTSSQGELSYRVSSLHVAFTAQKVRLTILWCRAKWNYRQRESTTQRLCENHALTSARLDGQKVEEFITTLEKSLPQPLYWKSPRKIGLLQGCGPWISHAQLR